MCCENNNTIRKCKNLLNTVLSHFFFFCQYTICNGYYLLFFIVWYLMNCINTSWGQYDLKILIIIIVSATHNNKNIFFSPKYLLLIWQVLKICLFNHLDKSWITKCLLSQCHFILKVLQNLLLSQAMTSWIRILHLGLWMLGVAGEISKRLHCTLNTTWIQWIQHIFRVRQ